eukprot:m.48474 g.48474  ORF g.48474 m.48474 type:complete len:350 (+) comp6425_c0_seq1:25-1074(+)
MTGVLKSGWLKKLGPRKTWKTRFFVLRHDHEQLQFEYYKVPDGEMLGSFGLKEPSCFRVLQPPLSGIPTPMMLVTTTTRTYSLTADSEVDVTEWTWAVEKSLSYLKSVNNPSQDTSIEKRGYLLKKGAKRHNWKRRWFELHDKTLKYYRRNRRDLLGIIDLKQCLSLNRIRDFSKGTERFTFVVALPTRRYLIMADSEAVLDSWLCALEKVGCPLTLGDPSGNSTFYTTFAGSDDSGSENEADSQQPSPVPPPRMAHRINRDAGSVASSAAGSARASPNPFAPAVAAAAAVATPAAVPRLAAPTAVTAAPAAPRIVKAPEPGTYETFYELHEAFRPPFLTSAVTATSTA